MIHATIDDLSAHILRLHSLVGRYAVHEATMIARGERAAGDYTLDFFAEWLSDQEDYGDDQQSNPAT